MKATRDAFGEQLKASAENNDQIIGLNADLAGATKINAFGKAYPERFLEMGIAENNMIGVASGLSEYGFKVFLASFASFLTGKYDAIRCSIAYSNAPCVLVGTHSGLAIGKDGVTQMGLEDISLMRSLPGVTVINPSTYNQTRAIVKFLCENKLTNPYYLRIGRQPVVEFYNEQDTFEIGKGTLHRTGSLGVVFSSGCVLGDVLEATEGLDLTVIDIHTIKPIDRDMVINYSVKSVFTVEDHTIIGGLGSAVAEIIADEGLDAKLNRIGLNDIFPESGMPSELYDKYGLSSQKIRERILSVIN
jgi:transketolase